MSGTTFMRFRTVFLAGLNAQNHHTPSSSALPTCSTTLLLFGSNNKKTCDTKCSSATSCFSTSTSFYDRQHARVHHPSSHHQSSKQFDMNEKEEPRGASQMFMKQWQTLNTHRKPIGFSDIPRMLRQLPDCPKPALYLGVGGLLPFIGPSLYFLMSHSYIPAIAWWQTAYAASLLGFLGGVRWGHTIPNAELSDSSQKSPVLQDQLEDEKDGTTPVAGERVNTAIARVSRHEQHSQHPQLLYSFPNWHALSYSIIPFTIGWTSLLLPQPVTEVVLLVSLAGLGFFDITLPGYPDWFKALRLLLTLVSCTCLTITIYAMVWHVRDAVRAEGS